MLASAPAQAARVVDVRVPSPAAVRRLAALGLDTGEVVSQGRVAVVLHAPADGRRLRRERTFLFPVVNPDGLAATRQGDPDRRKNCSGGPPGTCGPGVDLNRNASAYWAGPGASDAPDSPIYRGPAPLSEPESAALHAFSAAHQVTVIDSVHTYGGEVLFQPGFSHTDEPGLPAGAT